MRISREHIATSLVTIAISLLLTACASTSPQSRRDNTDKLLAEHAWKKGAVSAGRFTLASFSPSAVGTSPVLTVYIEGDGFAFRAKQVSEDPTPLNPVALQMAFRHAREYGQAVYLARPCQYVVGADAHNCDDKYWSFHRFAPEVIDATDKAIDQLKQRYGAKELVLVGYSGGGAVAALVAARRKDVKKLVTVAGTLDHRPWTAMHRVSAMDPSLNPADAWDKLQPIPQLHFVGGKDKIMPVAIAESYRSRFPQKSRPDIRINPDFDHECCWAEQWASLQATAFK